MPDPIALCLEDLDAEAGQPCFVRCVALVGGEPGLALAGDGAIAWRGDQAAAAGLKVSLDQRLVLLRPDAGPEVTVRRGGRSLAVPAGKPVVLLDGDQLECAGRRLRLHVHGVAPAVAAPEALPPAEPAGRLGRVARAAATALALGAAVGAAGCKTIEVRDRPPTVPEEIIPDQTAPKPDMMVRPDTKPIEVRETPPVVAPLPPPPGAAKPGSDKKTGK